MRQAHDIAHDMAHDMAHDISEELHYYQAYPKSSMTRLMTSYDVLS